MVGAGIQKNWVRPDQAHGEQRRSIHCVAPCGCLAVLKTSKRQGSLWETTLAVYTFTDHYEVLEISPNANSETIDRIFRYFAQRYHPDNPDTGNRPRFDEIVDAYSTLRDPIKRAQYDLQHKDHLISRRDLVQHASGPKGSERDADIQDRLLSILYANRRRNMENPGIGNVQLEQLLSCPREHLEFHLWYMKEKGWIRTLENGQLAITAEGVDRAHSEPTPRTTLKLLKDLNPTG
jgi:DnaJ-domain-containing protein 1